MEESSRRIAVIHKGALEAAGLGEVAYFLRKARQQLDHAKFALENIDFSRSAEMLQNAGSRVDAIEKLMLDMRDDLSKAEQAALVSVEEKEEKDAQAEQEKAEAKKAEALKKQNGIHQTRITRKA